MGFDVRKEDADALAAWVKAFAVGMQRNLEDVAAAASALGEVDDFTGAAADSSRAYWKEVHVPILKGLDAAVRDLYFRYGEYMAVLDGVDAARDAWLEYDALTRAEADFGGLPGDVAGFSSSLATVLEEIRDVIDLPAPSEAALTEELSDLACLPRAHCDTMEGAEDFYAASAEGLGELLSQLARAIGYAGSVGSFASYAPGSAQSRPWAGGLAAATEASLGSSSVRFEAAHTAYTAAADRMQNRFEELLDKRADHGAADMLVGGVTVLLGGLTIALTGSAAIPFVVPMMAFGSAQFVEGSQNLVYGSSDDLGSTAWNPIRDTVFLGNQDWYNFGYGVAELSAAWGAPFLSAFTAAKATGLSGLKAAPTFVKSFAEGAAKDAAYDAGVDFAFTTIVDPQIDKCFAGTEMGSALKEVSRDAFEQVTSMPCDVADPGKKTSGSVHADVPKAGLPLKDGPYIKDGKPNGRPKLSGAKKLEFERAVYGRQVGPDGVLRDPNTGEEIEWKPGEKRQGVCDFGHAEIKYSDLFDRYRMGEISLDQLKAYEFNPDNFQIETPSANRSPKYE